MLRRIKNQLNEQILIPVKYWQIQMTLAVMPAIIVGLVWMVIAQAVLLRKCRCYEQIEKQQLPSQTLPATSSPFPPQHQKEAERSATSMARPRFMWTRFGRQKTNGRFVSGGSSRTASVRFSLPARWALRITQS